MTMTMTIIITITIIVIVTITMAYHDNKVIIMTIINKNENDNGEKFYKNTPFKTNKVLIDTSHFMNTYSWNENDYLILVVVG
mgnify:CR=1 FL=1|tara:strand:+ start:184 stop:429 length:246 start_codon:yes stop_codon:yes gene_type:complete